MRVFITGGTGFIGQHLVSRLLGEGHQVTVWTRSPGLARALLGTEVALFFDHGDDALAQMLCHCDAMINLAGESIFAGRWNAARKEAIIDSRVGLTERLVHAAGLCSVPPAVLVSGSAVGFYGNRGAEPLTEDAAPGDDFLAKLCIEWERQAAKAEAIGMRVARIRTGIVLGREGGALARMLPPFRMGLGGPLGSGEQYVPWIHLDDLGAVLTTALTDSRYQGPINATAPAPVTNAEFARELGKALNRPARLPAPAFALKMVLGEAAEALLGGQRAIPQALNGLGFSHRFETVAECLADLVG